MVLEGGMADILTTSHSQGAHDTSRRERERERDRERETGREKDRERERETERESVCV